MICALVSCTEQADAIDSQSEALESLHLAIDLQQTSTSGLSSGAFMAVQFHVAHASIMRGVASFAGGPYDCALGSMVRATTTCMVSSDTDEAIDTSLLRSLVDIRAALGLVDAPAHLHTQHAYFFGGALDNTVRSSVSNAAAAFYKGYTPHVTVKTGTPGVAHTMPTLEAGGLCSQSESPFVGACNLDGAGEALAAIYGDLIPKREATGLRGTIAQGNHLQSYLHSLAPRARIYIPQDCARGEACKIHVAFHGCKQGDDADAWDTFTEHAGYNEWAEANKIVMLYPRVRRSASNPNGCWDFWGYDSPFYATKIGPQQAIVRSMLEALARGTTVLAKRPHTPRPELQTL